MIHDALPGFAHDLNALYIDGSITANTIMILNIIIKISVFSTFLGLYPVANT